MPTDDAYEQLLQQFKEAGIVYIEALQEGLKRSFDKTAQEIKQSSSRLRHEGELEVPSLVAESVRQAASFASQSLSLGGARGSFGEYGRRFATFIGYGMAKILSKELSESGANILSMATQYIAYNAASAVQKLEEFRMAGAKYAPILSNFGRPSPDRSAGQYASMGGEAMKQTAEIRRATMASEEEALNIATAMSRLGIPFNEFGTKASTYIVAADVVLNLQRGLTQDIVTSSMTRFTESWDASVSVIGFVAEKTRQWRKIAESTHNKILRSIASTNTVLKMYNELGDSFSSTGLGFSEMTGAFTFALETMSESGIRETIMPRVLHAMTSMVSPVAGTALATAEKGVYFEDVLARTEAGRAVLKRIYATAKKQGFSSQEWYNAIPTVLAQPGETTAVVGALLLGVASATRQFGVTPTIDMLEQRFGVGDSSYSIVKIALRLDQLVNSGMDQQKAMNMLNQDALVQSILGTQGKGPTVEDLIFTSSEISTSGLSEEEKLVLWVRKNVGGAVASMTQFSEEHPKAVEEAGQKYFLELLRAAYGNALPDPHVFSSTFDIGVKGEYPVDINETSSDLRLDTLESPKRIGYRKVVAAKWVEASGLSVREVQIHSSPDDALDPGTVLNPELLAGLEPGTSARAQKFLQELQRLGYKMRITSGHRSFQQQQALYAGRQSNPNPVAIPGTSRHESGRAWDMTLQNPAGKTPSTQEFKKIEKVAKQNDIIWGGRFNDPVHWEYRKG